MHGRPIKVLTALAMLATAGGCVQATRHSNTMLFGTNTTVGFKVGQGANQVPEIILAYDRQEAVIMPLVANTGDNGDVLTPCNVAAPVPEGG